MLGIQEDFFHVSIVDGGGGRDMLQAPVLAVAVVVAVAVAVHLQLHPGTCGAATHHPMDTPALNTPSLYQLHPEGNTSMLASDNTH